MNRAVLGEGASIQLRCTVLPHPLSGSLFISIPVDLTSDPELAKLEEKGVKGRYVSVESLTELPTGKTEWRMATSSRPGGLLPSFLVDSTMASAISAVSISRYFRRSTGCLNGSMDYQDVPHFLKWYQSVRAATDIKGAPTLPTASDPTTVATPHQ